MGAGPKIRIAQCSYKLSVKLDRCSGLWFFEVKVSVIFFATLGGTIMTKGDNISPTNSLSTTTFTATNHVSTTRF